jgi:hypothetical protein
MKLHFNSEVARRVDGESFRIAKILKKINKNPSFLGVCGLQWKWVHMYVGWMYNMVCIVGKIHENLRR